jgi:hypothetical protein
VLFCELWLPLAKVVIKHCSPGGLSNLLAHYISHDRIATPQHHALKGGVEQSF